MLILAFDGLEYELVEKYKLTSLKQRQYGKLSIPKECYAETVDFLGNKIFEPWTPLVWGSFLTGKLPTDFGLSEGTIKQWRSPILQFLKTASMRLGLSRIKKKGVLFEKLGFKRNPFMLTYDQTFLKGVKSKVLSFPLLSDGWSLKLPKGLTASQIIEKYWENYMQMLDSLFEELISDWDILMCYTRLLDIVGELRFGDKIPMMKAYFSVNTHVKKIKDCINAEIFCLIISDHGIQPFYKGYGKHSNHAFYSCNRTLNPKPHSITDFYNIIKQELEKAK